MALNIPMPGLSGDTLLKGLDTGSSMFTRIMNPILERERQKQAQAQFEKELELKKQQEARMNANMGLNRQILQQRLLGLQHQNDPNYQFDQFKALQDKFAGNMGGATQNMPQEPMPQQEMGEGMGVFTPEGLKQAQEAPQVQQQPQQQGGLNMEAIKNNPMLRGWFKHQFGYDPLAEQPMTQAEKDAHEISLFKAKEDIKKANKGIQNGTVPLTKAMETKLQGVVTGVDNSLPILEELIKGYQDVPKGAEWANPAAYAAYDAKANAIVEPLVNAMGLNVTDQSLKMMHDQVFRRTNESLPKYRDRLITLAKDIIRRRGDSFKSLQGGTVSPKSELTPEHFESLKNPTSLLKPNSKFANHSDNDLLNMLGGSL